MSSKADQQGQKLFRFLCRHLVGLGVSYWREPYTPGERPHFTVYSGTLISIRNVVYFLSAGHSMRNLRDSLRNPAFKKDRIRLIDSFGLNAVDRQPIPFAVEPEDIFYVDDEQLGLDFGLIRLRPYYINLLSKNGTIAIGEENWVHQHRVRFDAYFMLGLPEEFTGNTLLSNGDARMRPTMVEVQPSPRDSRELGNTAFERFVGRIGNGIESVVGMSGGPIVGFNFGEPARYWVVALQSTWIKESRTTFGCPIATLGSLITAWTDDAVR